MKKNTYTSIFFILFSLITIAQTNGVCVYKVHPIESELSVQKNDTEIIKKAKNILIKTVDYAKKINFILKFNSVEAVSQIEQNLAVDNNESTFLRGSAIAVVGKGVYYQNKEDNYTLWQLNTMGETFLIKDDLKTSWTITKETKKIGNYLAYKAVKNCKSCNDFEEVWFTPSINVPFGPLNYGGLPGLVLEIRKKAIVLRLEKITLKKNKTIIKKPSKGRKVTANEFKVITDRVRAEARN